MTNMRASAARRRNKPLKPHNRSRLAALALAAALVGSLFLSSCGKEKSQSPQQVPQEQTARSQCELRHLQPLGFPDALLQRLREQLCPDHLR